MNPLKLFAALILIALFSTNSFTQPVVIEHSVIFSDENTATLVGEDGVAMTTTDGGITWTQQNTGLNNVLYSTEYISSDVIVAVGENGIIIKSYDAGLNWRPVTSGITSNLFDVDFISDFNQVVACGEEGIVLLSTDYGETWFQNVDIPAVKFNDLHYDNNNNILYMVGDYTSILMSTNGGDTWTWIPAPTPIHIDIKACAVNSSGKLTIVGHDRFAYTTGDFGITWTVAATTGFELGDLNDITFFGNSTGIMVGEDGIILRSVDDGEFWEMISINEPINADLNSVAFSSSLKGVAVGDNGTERYSTDGGLTWIETAYKFSNLKNRQEISGISNYPNPFNPSTTISFVMPKAGNVKVSVFDMTGKEVSRLYDGYTKSGIQEYLFNANNLSSGIYFYNISGDGFKSITKKMVLVK